MWCQEMENYIFYQDQLAPSAETWEIVSRSLVSCQAIRGKQHASWLEEMLCDLSDFCMRVIAEISMCARRFVITACELHEVENEKMCICDQKLVSPHVVMLSG